MQFDIVRNCLFSLIIIALTLHKVSRIILHSENLYSLFFSTIIIIDLNLFLFKVDYFNIWL